MTVFDARSYWAHVDGFENDLPLTASPEHARQELALEAALATIGPVETVLDVGCGRGRIAALLQRALPNARYTGLDINERHLELTARVRPDGEYIWSAVQDLEPVRSWDLVVTSEILMHIPPVEVDVAVEALQAAARRFLVVAEWVPEVMKLPGVIDQVNWPHDYFALLGPVHYAARTDQQLVLVQRRAEDLT